MTAYYNEIEPFAAQWLRNLIAAGHIAPGDVDERSIVDVQPEDLRGYTQCHFFAGIGVWSRAIRLAGWSDARPVWTGSCPCQPFSAAGAQRGSADERHLWPAWFRLICECRPATVFGEQVAGGAGLAWLDHVCADLEDHDYAVGAADLCAAGAGAPHIRQRLYFVAHASGERRQQEHRRTSGDESANARRAALPDHVAASRGAVGDVGNPRCAGSQGRERPRADAGEIGERRARPHGAVTQSNDGATAGYWSDVEWIWCRDNKWRPTQPGLFPLAYGTPSRVGRLRAYGNAIVAPLAAEFIRAADGVTL